MKNQGVCPLEFLNSILSVILSPNLQAHVSRSGGIIKRLRLLKLQPVSFQNHPISVYCHITFRAG